MTARAFVVGGGVTCAAGTGKDRFWSGLMSGQSYAETCEFADTDLRAVCTRIDNADLEGKLDPADGRRLDRIQQLAIVASDEAITDGGLDIAAIAPERRGIVVGIGFGAIGTLTTTHQALRERGWRRISPFAVAAALPSGAASVLSIRHGVTGPVTTVSSACASGTHAIGDAYRMIAWGVADVVIAGGAEAPLDALPIGGFTRMGAMTRRLDDPASASRPFDRDRDGFVIGEGSGFVVLATERAAAAMGALVYGEVTGFSISTDAHHITAPDQSGVAVVRCIREAVSEAGTSLADLSHLNAHGTSTKLNDAAEAAAITTCAEDGPGPPVVALKGAIGHLMGGAGAVELVASLLAMRHGTLPPTVNFKNPDDGVVIDVSGDARPIRTDAPFLSTSFGFGGQNAAIVVSPP